MIASTLVGGNRRCARNKSGIQRVYNILWLWHHSDWTL